MEDDLAQAADSIIADLLNSTDPNAVAAGTLLQNQSFGFAVQLMTGTLGFTLGQILGAEDIGSADPLNTVLNTVKGVVEATGFVNTSALPMNTAVDQLTVGGLTDLKTQMDAFLASNPNLEFLTEIVENAVFLQSVNPLTIRLLQALDLGDAFPFLDAIDIAVAFFDGFDPSALAFAAIAANAPAAINAEAPEDTMNEPDTPDQPDDNTEDPVAPDEPTDPPAPTPPVVDPEDPVLPDPTDNSGNDVFSGGGGSQSFDGGRGADSLSGGGGKDTLKGGAGKDTLDGGGGADEMSGGGGADHMLGRGGKDTMEGGGGRDTIEGGGGKDLMSGNGGRDEMLGGGGKDTMDGGGGKDMLDGGKGRDMLMGGGGKDTLKGGKGNDTLEGGGGKDMFVFDVGDKGDTIIDMDFNKDKVIINDPDRAGQVLTAEQFALQVIFGLDENEANDLEVTITNQGQPSERTVIKFLGVSPDDFNTDAFEFQRGDGELDDGDQIL